MEYPIVLGQETVGNACVERQGLYCRIECRCKLSGSVLYKILVSSDGRQEDLGICVPEGDDFILRTRIPAKRLEGGALHFRAVPRHSALTGKFVPLSPQEPFRYLSELKNAYLKVHNGQTGIVLAVKPED